MRCDGRGSSSEITFAGDDAIVGQPMPLNPLTGEGRLREAEPGDIQTWIVNGARWRTGREKSPP